MFYQYLKHLYTWIKIKRSCPMAASPEGASHGVYMSNDFIIKKMTLLFS